jgi:hypothetical protein
MSYRSSSISALSLSPLSASNRPVSHQLCIFALLACGVGFFSEAQASGQRVCKPALAFKEVRFSAMRPPTLERKWTAVLSVDASSCKTTSGIFEIGFSRLKENAIDSDFQVELTWHPTSVEVSVDFWADEAVEGYWLTNIAPCPCRD